MKTLLMLLSFFIAVDGYSQKKKKADEKDVQIDTLTRANALLTQKLDSVTTNQQLYYGLYTTLKEKVLLKDFDPARLPVIIDSIRAGRDSANALVSAPIASLRDSLSIMKKENGALKARADSMSLAINEYTTANTDKKVLIADLKELKSLLDAKIINQAEFESKKKLIMDKWQ